MKIKFDNVPKIYIDSVHTSQWYEIQHETPEHYVIMDEGKMTCVVTKSNPNWRYVVDTRNILNTSEEIKLVKETQTLIDEFLQKQTDLKPEVSKILKDTLKNSMSKEPTSLTRVFESGAIRDSNQNKPFIHNLKAYTRLRFGYHMNLGASKYGDSNWTKGMPTDQYLESIDRHLALYMIGDRTEDHLSAIIFGINGIMCNEKTEGIPADYYFKLLQPKMKAGEPNV